MDAIDKAIAESLERLKSGAEPRRTSIAPADPRTAADAEPVDPFSPEAILRAANEDDDLYDPYSDYMDMVSRSSYEEPEEDPWR